MVKGLTVRLLAVLAAVAFMSGWIAQLVSESLHGPLLALPVASGIALLVFAAILLVAGLRVRRLRDGDREIRMDRTWGTVIAALAQAVAVLGALCLLPVLAFAAPGAPATPLPAASVPTVSTQPSTSTNSRILNGADTSIGDSIIMPMDISTLATTRSMITNGMKIRKPISKAVFSSLVTNEATSTGNGIASGLA